MMRFDSPSAFLDSFDYPSPFHIVFWILGCSSSNSNSDVGSLVSTSTTNCSSNTTRSQQQQQQQQQQQPVATIQRSVTWEDEEEKEGGSTSDEDDVVSSRSRGNVKLVKVQVQCLLSSSALDNNINNNNNESTTSVDAGAAKTVIDSETDELEEAEKFLDAVDDEHDDLLCGEYSIAMSIEEESEEEEWDESNRIYSDARMEDDDDDKNHMLGYALGEIGSNTNNNNKKGVSTCTPIDFPSSTSYQFEENDDDPKTINASSNTLSLQEGVPVQLQTTNKNELDPGLKFETNASPSGNSISPNAEDETSLKAALPSMMGTQPQQQSNQEVFQEPQAQTEEATPLPSTVPAADFQEIAQQPEPQRQIQQVPSAAKSSGNKHNNSLTTNWKLIPPGPGDAEEKLVNGINWYWCTKCAKRGKFSGRWSQTHGTSTHTPAAAAAASSHRVVVQQPTTGSTTREETTSCHDREQIIDTMTATTAASEQKMSNNDDEWWSKITKTTTTERIKSLLPTEPLLMPTTEQESEDQEVSIPHTQQHPATITNSGTTTSAFLLDDESLLHQTLFSHLLSSPVSSIGGGGGGDERSSPPPPSSLVVGMLGLEPQLEDIPMLLLTEMQKEDSVDVARALEALGELLEEKKRGWGITSSRDHSSFTGSSTTIENNNNNNNNDRHYLRQLGTHSIVILCMRKFRDNQDVQARGCYCLALLASDDPETTMAILLLGGLEVAVNAINRFSSSVPVQRNAFNFLITVFVCVESQIEASRKVVDETQSSLSHPVGVVIISEREGMAIYDRYVNEMDGITILLRSMRNFSKVARVLSPCCGILSILAVFGHKTALKEAGAVSAVAVAMENNPKDDEMNHHSRNFMVSMFS